MGCPSSRQTLGTAVAKWSYSSRHTAARENLPRGGDRTTSRKAAKTFVKCFLLRSLACRVLRHLHVSARHLRKSIFAEHVISIFQRRTVVHGRSKLFKLNQVVLRFFYI